MTSPRGLALFVLLAAAPAWGQERPLDPPDLARYHRWGPLRARPGLLVKDVGYDNNILATSENAIGDYTATVAPRLEGLMLFGDRAFLTFQEEFAYTFYQENSDQNFRNQRGSARVTLPVRKFGFFADGVLNRLEQRPVDLTDIRPLLKENGYGFGVIFEPAWRTDIELSQSRLDMRYSDDDDPTIGERLDRNEDSTSLNVTYRLFGRSHLTFETYRKEIDFDSAASQFRNSTEIALIPGINLGLGGKLSGQAAVGWVRIDAEDPTLTDLRDFIGEAEFYYRPGARTTFRLKGRQEPGFTVSGSSIYFLATRFELGAVYYLNRTLGFESAGAVGNLDFSDDPREDDLQEYEVGLRFRVPENSLGKRTEYALRFKRSRRTSTLPSQNVSETTFGIDAILGF